MMIPFKTPNAPSGNTSLPNNGMRHFITMTVILLLSMISSSKAWATTVAYIDADGSEKQISEGYTVLEDGEAITLTTGWYVVNTDITCTSIETESEQDVNLILCDGATMTINCNNDSGFAIVNKGNLTIYGQANNTGTLTTQGIGAGIDNSGTITINSGTYLNTEMKHKANNTYCILASESGGESVEGFEDFVDVSSSGNGGYGVMTDVSDIELYGFNNDTAYYLWANLGCHAQVTRYFSEYEAPTSVSVDVGMLWDSNIGGSFKGIEFMDSSDNAVFGIKMQNTDAITYYGANGASGTWSEHYGNQVFTVTLTKTDGGYIASGTTRTGDTVSEIEIETDADICTFKAYMDGVDDDWSDGIKLNIKRQLYFDNIRYTVKSEAELIDGGEINNSGTLVINGGKFSTREINNSGTMTINGGLVITEIGLPLRDNLGGFIINNSGTLAINGGQVGIGRIDNQGSTTLGCSNAEDFIITDYNGTIQIKEGLTLYDEGCNSFSGTLSDDQRNYIAFEKLMACVPLANSADNSATLTANAAQGNNVILFDHSLYKDNLWDTLCLPFAVNDFTGTPLEGATVKELLSTSNLDSDGNLTLNLSADRNAIEAGKPYIVKCDADLIINNAADWEAFTKNVNGLIEIYRGKVVRLNSDIDVSTMVGEYLDRTFKGTFDGAGHTLNVNINGWSDFCAPFSYIKDATIANLRTTGTVSLTSDNFYAGGLVSYAEGGMIKNCHVSTRILFPNDKEDAFSGGIIGRTVQPTVMTDCLFDGSIGYSSGTGNMSNVAGLVGWNTASDLTITNCLNAGTFANANNISKIARAGGCGTITNCYSTINATSQGEQNDNRGTYTTATGEELVALLGSGWQVENNEVVPKIVPVGLTNPIFRNVNIKDAAPTAVKFSNAQGEPCQFVGRYAPLTIDDTNIDQIMLLAHGDDNLSRPQEASILNAFRAHFVIPASSKVNNIQINFNDAGIATGINEELRGVNEESVNDVWYDLQGRKVNKNNVKNGIYIVKGKKVFVK